MKLTPEQAADAVYIDFECLKGRPPARPQPKLLGVLFGTHDEQIDQLILDERLAPAAVANRRTQVMSVADAVETLVAAAHANECPLVGWSFFDRDRMIDARPDLESEIHACYVNAIQIARPWRSRVYPMVKIEREDEFAPRHTLDKYARLTGYRQAKALEHAEPARWIQHVLKQLEVNRGRYRTTTRQTKRDWHAVLEYNRHDLLALRHIVLRATHELSAWHAYERTRFCVDEAPRRRTCFMAGSGSPRLDRLLERHGADQWAFITAWNPRSLPLDRAENDARQQALERSLVQYRTLPGEGVGEDPAWPPEESLLVLDIPEDVAVELGRQFGQLAIVVGRRGEKSRLVSTADPQVPRFGADRRRLVPLPAPYRLR